jgi:hypothetical protein
MSGTSKDDVIGLEDTLVDDDELLPDKLLRQSHRAKDGHVATSQQEHDVDAKDNMLVLYVYTRDNEGCVMHPHYVYSPYTQAYNRWRELAWSESRRIEDAPDVIGVFGWSTTFVNFTALREGDVLTCVTKEKFVYVRLTFNTGKANGAPRATKQKKQRQ